MARVRGVVAVAVAAVLGIGAAQQAAGRRVTVYKSPT